ncbi:MAG: recombinase family protein [Gammaproteobacteria bacterium]|nr:recombinase family protein [Gammaproteobacteria bacterium]MBU1732826.1 recombinase family protein [Gammaproteobacteria bacterium]MBU1891651.1 recombinase family protein [Gammaproteobacteria bacterium]
MFVISYTRFSTGKQAHGDSLRRQLEAAEKWCVQNGTTLDNSLHLHDAGVSGWTGRNARVGALSKLLHMARERVLPAGTVLLIENLDRLSRGGLTFAIPLMLDLLAAGVEIVTLQDRQRWSQETIKDSRQFISSVLTFSRANEESEAKAKRVREVFEEHRKIGSSKIFGSAPGWLRRENKTSAWIVIPELAAVVVKVFELAASGHGSKQIARIANSEKWPVPTRIAEQSKGWHSRLPGQLLRSRQVLGEHTHRRRGHEQHSNHWEGELVGDAIPDYYPRIVDDELWHRARAAVTERRTSPGRRDRWYYNIFAGRLFCGHCGASMQRKVEARGERVSGSLICGDALPGKTRCPSCAVRSADAPIVSTVCMLAASHMSDETAAAGSALLVARNRLAELDAAAERIADIVTATGGAMPAFIKKSQELAEQRKAVAAEADALEHRAAATAFNPLNDAMADKVLTVLYERGEDAARVRADFNARLRQAVQAIWLFPYEAAVIQFRGHNEAVTVHLPPKRTGDKSRFVQTQTDGSNKLLQPGLADMPPLRTPLHKSNA